MRCVEAWSMVVPWIGFPLRKSLALAEPTSDAKYVAFETIYAPDRRLGQQDRFIGGGLKYPYVEGLRLDEAMHPLTLMTSECCLWQGVTAAKWRAGATDCAVEIWL